MSIGKDDPAMVPGAVGHLLADANEEELALLMFSTERGEARGTFRMARHILGVIAASAKPKPLVVLEKPKERLSPRELQVLRLISQGWSNRKIADTLHRSANTIDTQIKSIYRKLAVNSRTQAVRAATQHGLLSWDASIGSAQAQ
jgi:DNA-binding NarL/FixJ family response regulator